ncbi:MAG: hypothetical protein ACLTKG_05815 [Collinsella intestinalis]
MKKFVTEIVWRSSGASLGVIVARHEAGERDITEDAQAIEQVLAAPMRSPSAESPTLSENAPVRAWRQAYQHQDQRGARCSSENCSAVLKGNPVGSISPSVDLYNAISSIRLPLAGGPRCLGGTCAFAPRRRRIHAAWRGAERPHAARRARLCR